MKKKLLTSTSLSLDPFKKFDLLPLSFSRLSKFINDLPGFYISYIHGYKGASCSMERGTWAEFGVKLLFEGKDMRDALYIAEQQYDQAVEEKNLQEDPKRKVERDNLPLYIKGFWKELRQYQFYDFQERLEHDILGVPVIGYTDFGLLYPQQPPDQAEDHYFKVDLKSSGKMPSSLSHSINLQQMFYAKVSNVENKVLYSVVSKGTNKTKWFTISNDTSYQKMFEDMIVALHGFLSSCEDKEDMKKKIVPNLDNWIWSYDPQVTKVRKEVWGY